MKNHTLHASGGIVPPPRRRPAREVRVGDVGIGGRNPVRIQSMTTTRGRDVEATVEAVEALARAGCEIVRVTTPTAADARALGEVRQRLRSRGIRIPLVADIHFLPAAAMEAASHVEKIRINPGNFADRRISRRREYTEEEYAAERDRIASLFRPLVLRLRERGAALRIGTNHGSLSDRITNRYGDTPLGMVEAALEYVRICREMDYHDVVLSMKASDPRVTIHANRLLVDRMAEESMDYPIHLGVTEAGEGEEGRIRSAVGIGVLLLEGIGDTIRVSLTEDPVDEIPVARQFAEDFSLPPAAESSGAPAMEIDAGGLPWNRYSFGRRRSREIRLGSIPAGGDHPPRVALAFRPGDPAPAAREILRLSALPETPLEIALLRLESEADLPWAEAVRGEAAEARVGWVISLPAGRIGRLPRRRPPADALELRLDSDAIPAAVPEGIPLCISIEAKDPATLRTRLGTALERLPRIDAVAAVSAGRDLAGLLRTAAVELHSKGSDALFRLTSADAEGGSRAAMRAAARLGGLLCDGIGDVVRIDAPDPPEQRLDTAYRILQACGARRTRAEFISCPSCGRTLFDLQTTTRRVRERTRHLRGVRIAVMGCVVNGPGEMADADFGYVGAGPGRVHLYVGRECVEKNVPEEEAPDRLVELIRRCGRWRDPA